MRVCCVLLFVFGFTLLAVAEGHAYSQKEHAEIRTINSCYVKCQKEKRCFKHDCAEHNEAPPSISIVSWSCGEHCQYLCLSNCTANNIANGGSMWKFLGKWPQPRWLGMQEPASAVFSLANAAAQFWFFLQLRARELDGSCFTKFWRVAAAMAVITWTFSFIFHAHDTPVNEKLDYVGANWHIFSFVTVALLRATNSTKFAEQMLITVPMMAAAVGYVLYMGFITFDYEFNMKVMVVLSIVQTIIWVAHCVRNPAVHNRLYYASTALVWAAALGLEVLFDFSPRMGVFDAHALWHMVTPLPIILFGKFICKDLVAHAKKSIAVYSLPRTTRDTHTPTGRRSVSHI